MNETLFKANDYLSLIGYIVSFVCAIKLIRRSGLYSFVYVAVGLGFMACNSSFWLALRFFRIEIFQVIGRDASGFVSNAMLVVHMIGMLFITIGLIRLYQESANKKKLVEQVAASDS